MRDVIVIGAGPAGLAAASYLLRKGVDLFVVSDNFGGKSALSLSLPGATALGAIRPRDIIQSFRDELEARPELFALGHAEGLTHQDGVFSLSLRDSKSNHGKEESRSVIVATGASPRHLNVPGEQEFRGKGLGYSSISYSHLLAGKRVFLVGDSQRTVEDAWDLANQAQEVAVLLLQDGSRYREIFEEQLAAISNVRVIRAEQIVAFEGDDFARSVTLKTGVGERVTLEADAFFVQLQPRPNSDIVDGIAATDEEERIVIDMRNRTTLPGLLAAGDVTNVGFEQILIALGEGSKAALTAYQGLGRP